MGKGENAGYQHSVPPSPPPPPDKKTNMVK